MLIITIMTQRIIIEAKEYQQWSESQGAYYLKKAEMQQWSEFSLMILLMLKRSILIKTKRVMWGVRQAAAIITQTLM